jgi:hypothetical protein
VRGISAPLDGGAERGIALFCPKDEGIVVAGICAYYDYCYDCCDSQQRFIFSMFHTCETIAAKKLLMVLAYSKEQVNSVS